MKEIFVTFLVRIWLGAFLDVSVTKQRQRTSGFVKLKKKRQTSGPRPLLKTRKLAEQRFGAIFSTLPIQEELGDVSGEIQRLCCQVYVANRDVEEDLKNQYDLICINLICARSHKLFTCKHYRVKMKLLLLPVYSSHQWIQEK